MTPSEQERLRFEQRLDEIRGTTQPLLVCCNEVDITHADPTLIHILEHLHRIESIMTEINADQARLDADVASLGNITASIETEIANLKQQPAAAALDFTGLENALSTLQGVAPSAPAPAAPVEPAPADPAPADAPAEPAPVDTPPAA